MKYWFSFSSSDRFSRLAFTHKQTVHADIDWMTPTSSLIFNGCWHLSTCVRFTPRCDKCRPFTSHVSSSLRWSFSPPTSKYIPAKGHMSHRSSFFTLGFAQEIISQEEIQCFSCCLMFNVLHGGTGKASLPKQEARHSKQVTGIRSLRPLKKRGKKSQLHYSVFLEKTVRQNGYVNEPETTQI